jgi:hypothetical protein
VPGVRSARYTGETWSLLVLHDGAPATRREVLRALEALDASPLHLIRPAVEPAPARPAPAPAGQVLLSLLSAALPPVPAAALAIARSLAS